MSDLRSALEGALGPMYRIEREVRPVGGCRLFVAAEIAGGPELLVKVLPAELSLTVDAAQFERELLLLGDRLAHPHLVAPRSGGRAGAIVYHTRRFVEGTTLGASLVRHGELPLRRAVAVLHDVLAALAHAHTGGVVHGDVKPDNILLTDGGTFVADTGILGAVARSMPAGGHTVAARALCVPAYLAPERRGDGVPVGPRDDVFAIGVLAHEMLTAKPPAPGGEPLEEVRALPAWLAQLVRRCLASEPAARFADAGAALAAVNRSSWGAG